MYVPVLEQGEVRVRVRGEVHTLVRGEVHVLVRGAVLVSGDVLVPGEVHAAAAAVAVPPVERKKIKASKEGSIELFVHTA